MIFRGHQRVEMISIPPLGGRCVAIPVTRLVTSNHYHRGAVVRLLYPALRFVVSPQRPWLSHASFESRDSLKSGLCFQIFSCIPRVMTYSNVDLVGGETVVKLID